MQTDRRFVEIETIPQLESHLVAVGALSNTVVSGLDLRDQELESRLFSLSTDGSLFLGCSMSRDLSEHVKQGGGMIFPIFPDLPFDPYRSELYTVAELMEGYERGNPGSLSDSVDARIFAYFKQRHSPGQRAQVLETLACRIHDHAIDRALRDLLTPQTDPALKVVGIMGGHKLRRDDPAFLDVARISRRLTQMGLFVATGGGPGAMEAGNLGAWLSELDEETLRNAVDVLKPNPAYNDPHYVERGFDVLDQHPTGQPSLAVPTWFYGHEPSNLFSTHIAKYFANSIREDGLLAIATYGVIYSPGSAGTIQEVFQDAAQNHYATMGVVSPMVFLGVDYWTKHRPVFPLLEALSGGKVYGEMVLITDEVEEVAEFVRQNPPREVDR